VSNGQQQQERGTMSKAERGNLFTRKKGGTYYCQWYVNGKQFVKALYKANGDPITERTAARKAAGILVRPYTAKDTADMRREAVNALRAAEEVAQDAEIAARPKTPIAETWKRYPYVRSHRGPIERELSATTITDNRQLWARFTRWAEAAKVVNVEDVTPTHAAAYRESLIAEGLSGHRVNLAVQTARIIFDLAGMKPNPFADLKRRANATKGRRELTMAELTAVCQSATGELRTLLAVGLYTGLRLGDAVSLAWENIALDLSSITRLPGKTAYKGRMLTIPVHPDLHTILAEIPRGTGPIMPTLAERYSRGKSVIAHAIRRHFEAAGIVTTEKAPGRMRQASVAGFHSLRHCFVSMQARAGTPESITRALVGHASTMVHAIYQHANGDDKRRAVASLPALGVPVDPEGAHDREQMAARAYSLPIEAVRQFLASLAAPKAIAPAAQ
jgi:integrase